MPHTISIESESFLRYITDKNKTISMYFENRENLYEDMPDNLFGKLLTRKSVIDFMDFTPSCLSLIAVVSNKLKRIFEQLNVSKNEYVFKRISIKGYTEDHYLLFIPNVYLQICLTIKSLNNLTIVWTITTIRMIIV